MASHRRLVLAALFRLFLLRVMLLALPMPAVARLLRLHLRQLAQVPANGTVLGAERDHLPAVGAVEVGRAVGAAAARAPVLATCLTEALAGHLLLRRRGAASQVHLGAARDGRGRPVFHAWLTAGAEVVLGAGEVVYGELAVYS